MSNILRNINALTQADKERLKELTTTLIIGVYNKGALTKEDKYEPRMVKFSEFINEIIAQIECFEILPQNIIDALNTQETDASGNNGFILQSNLQSTVDALLEIIESVEGEAVLRTSSLEDIENYTGIHPIIIYSDASPTNVIYTYNPDSEDGDIIATGKGSGSWFILQSGGEDAILTEDVFVNTINNIQIGETLLEGLTFTEYIKKKYQAIFNPTFNTAVSATLSSSVTGTREVGENFNTTLSVSFNRGTINGILNLDGTWNPSGVQNQRAGAAHIFIIDGELNLTNSLSVSRTLVLGSNVFTASVNYLQGPQPLNSLNQPFGSPLAAGSINTNNVTITARLRQFFGSISSVPSTSNDIRTLSGNNFDTVNSFTIVTGTTATKFVIAIPSSKNLVSVIDTGNLNANITNSYILLSSTFVVQDIGGTNRNYKVYLLELGTPYSVSTNHLITLS